MHYVKGEKESNPMEVSKKVQIRNITRFFEDTINIWSVLLLILVFYFLNDAFLNKLNLKNLLSNMAPLLVMATGATLVRLIGSVDLSMGAVCSVANVILVHQFPSLGWGAYFAAAAFGIFAGFLLGVVQTKFKMPSFIASLGFMSIWESVALLITNSPIAIASEQKIFIEWGKINFGVLSLMTIIALVITLIFYLFQSYTRIGRSINIIGGNERAAWLSGIEVARYKIIAFVLCGLTAALCGIMLAVKLNSSAPTIGRPFTLLAVAAVLLGGTSASGGKGNILKTISGVLIVIIIQNGMTIIGVDAFWSQIVFGGLIIVAMLLNTERGTKNIIVK
jgi:ribose transport system permease protein